MSPLPNPVNFLPLKGCPNLRIYKTLVPVGTGGCLRGCAASEVENKFNFQSQFAWFGAFFLPRAPTQSQTPSFQKIGEGAPPASTLNQPLIAPLSLYWFTFLSFLFFGLPPPLFSPFFLLFLFSVFFPFAFSSFFGAPLVTLGAGPQSPPLRYAPNKIQNYTTARQNM